MMKTYKGIDLSKHNTVVSWDDVFHQNNIDFIILRAGGHFNGFYKDPKFEQYYNACKMYGIPVGCYYDCGKMFYNEVFAEKCAGHFYNLINGKQFEYPVFMDIEVTPKCYKHNITKASIAFCRRMEKLGYYVGIYASDISGFYDSLDLPELKAFDKWVARYGKEPQYVKQYGIWQHSSTGSVVGIKGPVDQDISYKNYPKIIKEAHLNGY